MADKKYPGWTDEAYPEIFTTIPPPVKEKKPGQLSEEQIKKFFNDGYVIIEKFFSPDELQPCKDAIERLIDDFAKMLFEGGKIKNLHKDKGLFDRLTSLEQEFPGATILLMKQGKLLQEYKDLWANERLLNAVEQLIGPNIQGHPVWNLRTKIPQNEATTVPWHQDIAYLDNDSYKVLQPAAWIPLLDTNEKNGCMEMISGGHRTGRICKHTCCWGNTWYVMLSEEEMTKTLGVDVKRDKVLCPIPYCGLILFNNLIPHRSLPNLSNQIRWSFDLRWQTPDKPVGFYGLKQGVLMRSASDPNLKINWESLEGTPSKEGEKKKSPDDAFDTTIVGPWMKKWEMVHTNRHTDRLSEMDEVSWHAPS